MKKLHHVLEDDDLSLSPSSSSQHSSNYTMPIPSSSSFSWPSDLTPRVTAIQRVNELKDEVKIMLEQQRLIQHDVFEYDAHCPSGIDLRYDFITLCRTFLGDENLSPYLPPYDSVSHQLVMLKFPQRDLVDSGAVQAYLREILAIKHSLTQIEEGKLPVEIIFKADPHDILVGESHVCLKTNIVSLSLIGNGVDHYLIQYSHKNSISSL